MTSEVFVPWCTLWAPANSRCNTETQSYNNVPRRSRELSCRGSGALVADLFAEALTEPVERLVALRSSQILGEPRQRRGDDLVVVQILHTAALRDVQPERVNQIDVGTRQPRN